MIGVITGLFAPRGMSNRSLPYDHQIVFMMANIMRIILRALCFGFFVIFLKRVFRMTVVALHSQGRRHELHGRHELVGWNSLKYLDVLIDLVRGPGN